MERYLLSTDLSVTNNCIFNHLESKKQTKKPNNTNINSILQNKQ